MNTSLEMVSLIGRLLISEAFPLASTERGLPDRLATDHDRIFSDETSKSPFPTRFHLWLLVLGIDLQFGRLGRSPALPHHLHEHRYVSPQEVGSFSKLNHTLA